MRNATLIGKGHLTWNADERRTDRYGSVRLANEEDKEPHDILIDQQHHALEGVYGKLVAKVTKPVKSPHMGDMFRGLTPSTPDLNEEVTFGEGYFFIERKGEAPPEPAKHQIIDKDLMKYVEQAFQSAGVKVTHDPQPEHEPVYDIIGLKPHDQRDTDWLDPKAFYRTHLSEVELYFIPTEEPK